MSVYKKTMIEILAYLYEIIKRDEITSEILINIKYLYKNKKKYKLKVEKS